MTQYDGRSEDSKVDSPVPVIPQLDQYRYFALHTLPPGEYTFSVSEDEQ